MCSLGFQCIAVQMLTLSCALLPCWHQNHGPEGPLACGLLELFLWPFRWDRTWSETKGGHLADIPFFKYCVLIYSCLNKLRLADNPDGKVSVCQPVKSHQESGRSSTSLGQETWVLFPRDNSRKVPHPQISLSFLISIMKRIERLLPGSTHPIIRKIRWEHWHFNILNQSLIILKFLIISHEFPSPLSRAGF